MNSSWANPWKLTAIGMGLVMATSLVTGLVVANWAPTSATKTEVAPSEPVPPPPPPATTVKPSPKPVAPTRVASSAAPARSGVPTQAAVDACNQQAAAQAGQHNKTMEVVKDATIGAVLGAAVGAAGGAIAGGGKGAGKGAIIGGLAGAGAVLGTKGKEVELPAGSRWTVRVKDGVRF
jgi:hypothetical protein